MFPRRLPAVVSLLCFGISMALSSDTENLCTSLCARPSGVNINMPFPSLGEAELSGRCLTVCGEEVRMNRCCVHYLSNNYILRATIPLMTG